MTTRRPRVPRAGASGRPDGTGRADTAGPSGTRNANDGGAKDEAEGTVIRPDFGRRGSAPSASGARMPAVPRSTRSPENPAARRAQERDSARYTVRQPVISWTKADDPAAEGAATPAGTTGSFPGSRSGSKGAAARSASAPGPRAASGTGTGTGTGAGSKRAPGGAGTKGVPAGIGAENSGGSGAGGTTDAEPAPVPAKAFSGRLLALAVVLITITVLLAPSVRTYLQQREELGALQAQIAEQEADRAELRNQLERWDDPAFIAQQARDRLFLVMPGERRYLVIGAGEDPEVQSVPTPAAGPRDVPWVDGLWQSIQRSAVGDTAAGDTADDTAADDPAADDAAAEDSGG